MLQSEALGEGHLVDQFESGAQSLDDWLKFSARTSDAKRQSRTYVWHQGDGVVVAYFALAPHVIERAVLPRSQEAGNLDQIPSLLLARLALDLSLQGSGLGSELLIDALSRSVSASNDVGGRFVVVDAIDQAAAEFYEHHGFRPCNTGDMRRLIRKVSDIAVSLG